MHLFHSQAVYTQPVPPETAAGPWPEAHRCCVYLPKQTQITLKHIKTNKDYEASV